MSCDRREFLRLLGLAGAVGLGGEWAFDALAAEALPEKIKLPEALSAQRWAMVIDLKKCLKKEGCNVCINACHLVHNVPDFGNTKDEIKWIWKERFENAFPDLESEYTEEALKDRPVLVFCNHCSNPPCVKVCPTQSTWKREDGIVMMDWHRCIGCRYCMAACPYGSRSFNWRDPNPFIKDVKPDFPARTRGVVEKCTFCAERLAIGKLPACVEACSEKTMVFGDLADPGSEVRSLLKDHYAIRRKAVLGTNPEIYYLV